MSDENENETEPVQKYMGDKATLFILKVSHDKLILLNFKQKYANSCKM